MIRIEYRKEVRELPAPLTVAEALQQLGYSPESYMAIRKGVLLDENDLLMDGDVIRLIPKFAGG